MKVCPVCDARAFDDATICYGCLYRYDEFDPDPEASDFGIKPDPVVPEVVAVPWEAEGADLAQQPPVPEHDSAPAVPVDLGKFEPASHGKPAFFIKLIPVLEESGGVTWSCAVELMTS